jgi:hypothetical protein
MPSGDYLWRTNDHEQTRREIARHSRLDAEAYDEYGKAMVAMGRFVKPILAMLPPDPTSLDPRGLRQLASLVQRFRELPRRDQYNQIQLMTMSAADFLDQWFETDVLKATMAASGIIGTFLGVRSPGTAYVLLHHYMGEIDGAFRSWGLARGGTGAISNAIAAAASAAVSRSGPGWKWRESWCGTTGSRRGARQRRRDCRHARGLEPGPAADVPAARRAVTAARRLRRGRPALQVPRVVRQGQPRARRPARLHLPAGGRAAPARRDFDLSQRELHGARLRRRQVRPLLAPALPRRRHPVAHGHQPRPARAST